VLGVWALTVSGASACEAPQGAAQAGAAVVAWANAERGARGLAPYRLSGAMAARTQACDMAVHGYFAHSRPGAPDLGPRIKATGYRFRAANENLAHTRRVGPTSAGRIWRGAPLHWAAVVDRGYRDVGVAIATGGGRVYWVMVVAR